MIGKLSGVIDEIYQDRIILDVSGVGYLIYIPQNTLLTLQKGENACFYIHTYVRDAKKTCKTTKTSSESNFYEK